jgi:hypothetical protein
VLERPQTQKLVDHFDDGVASSSISSIRRRRGRVARAFAPFAVVSTRRARRPRRVVVSTRATRDVIVHVSVASVRALARVVVARRRHGRRSATGDDDDDGRWTSQAMEVDDEVDARARL